MKGTKCLVLSLPGLWVSRRAYHRSPALLRSAVLGEQLHSLTVLHKQAKRHEQKQYEKEAWRLLQTSTEAEINDMDSNNIAEALVAWNYFSTFWERGVNGPRETASAPLSFPRISREEADTGSEVQARREVTPPLKRADPLDEVIDF